MMETRGPTIRMLAISIAALALSCSTAFGARAHFVSSKPIYAKVAVNQSGTKVLALALDESKGTGKGYDRIYADGDFDGVFDESEQLPANTRSGEGITLCDTRPFDIATRFNRKATRDSMASVMYASITARGAKPEQHLALNMNTDMRSGASDWSYSMIADLDPAASLAKAPVVKMVGPLKLRIETKADTKRGYTGIGLDMSMGKVALRASSAPGMAPATIRIIDSRGRLVKEDSGSIDKFSFG